MLTELDFLSPKPSKTVCLIDIDLASSRSSCKSWHPSTYPSQFVGRCLTPVSALLFFMEVKLGPRPLQTCSDYAEMTDLHPVSSLSPVWRFHVQKREGDHKRDCVKADMNACSIGGIDPQNRTAWRSGIRRVSRLLPTSATGKNRSS